jgi:hypothetical protein
VAYDWKTDLPGVFSRHADGCPMRETGECSCGPLGYRSSIRDWETNRRSVSPMYETLVEALSWQRDQIVTQDASRGLSLDRGELGSLIDEFLQSVEDGLAGPQNGRENARALRGALSYVDSELGTMAVQDVRRRHIQALLDQLRETGVAPARIHSVVDALHALYGYAIQRELVGFSPVVELHLPDADQGVARLPPTPTQPDQNGGSHNAAWQNGGAPAEAWPPPPQVGDHPWTPPPYTAPPFSQPMFAPPPPGYGPPGQTSGGFAAPYPTAPPYPTTPPPWATGYGQPTGPLSAIFGMAPDQATSTQANYDATMQERWLWWTVRIIVIVFVLIALVLVAESV